MGMFSSFRLVRMILVSTTLAAMVVSVGHAAAPSQHVSDDPVERVERSIPVSGVTVLELAAVDTVLIEAMKRYRVRNGSVGIVKDGRLVFAHGYGTDERDEAVTPETTFRIASLSKPITAVAVMKLVEEGRVRLDDKPFRILSDIRPPFPFRTDRRVFDMTVADLLRHSGGWGAGQDDLFDDFWRTLIVTGTAREFSDRALVQLALTRKLEADPGTKFTYVNLGYVTLGLLIERVTGMPYANYVRAAVLEPAGAFGTRVARDSFSAAIAAAGGWTSTPTDMLRFLTTVDGLPTRPDILRPETIATMTARPPAPLWAGSPRYYALGWFVTPVGNDAEWSHPGTLPGTRTIIFKGTNGVAMVALFETVLGEGDNFNEFMDVVEAGLRTAASQVSAWPEHDFF